MDMMDHLMAEKNENNKGASHTKKYKKNNKLRNRPAAAVLLQREA
jgi:hypothetical protein